VAEQARLMGERVQHELDRARMAASAGAVGVATEIGPVVEALARTLGRIHGDRSIELEAATEPGVVFRGERQDLEEVVGNLLDNACKWASRKVTVTAAAEPDSADGRRWWRLAIEDDGPGLDEAARAEALRRGGRLDETKPGSGLGLSIVSDLVGAYGGTLTLSRASLGGLRADVRLPAV
jgi:signal transduction histidine kinase